jgi:hypothetical protein
MSKMLDRSVTICIAPHHRAQVSVASCPAAFLDAREGNHERCKLDAPVSSLVSTHRLICSRSQHPLRVTSVDPDGQHPTSWSKVTTRAVGPPARLP